MFSWFPIYFPIKVGLNVFHHCALTNRLLFAQTPIYVAKGDTIDIHIWRKSNSAKVWYEWAVGSPAVTPIHNIGGRSHAIGLY